MNALQRFWRRHIVGDECFSCLAQGREQVHGAVYMDGKWVCRACAILIDGPWDEVL